MWGRNVSVHPRAATGDDSREASIPRTPGVSFTATPKIRALSMENQNIDRPTFVTHLECGKTGTRYQADQLHGLSKLANL